MYDWNKFLRGVRPKSADRDLQVQFSLQFQVQDDAIQIRTKGAVSAQVKFGPWVQILPHPGAPTSGLPHRDTTPAVAPVKPWPEFTDKIAPLLLSFYRNEFQHPVHFESDECDEMISFLSHGPPPPTPPVWIDWNVAPVQTTPAVPVPAPAPIAAVRRRGRLWKPFLQPRSNAGNKKCRCGSSTHLKVTHMSCPLNPSRTTTPNEADASTPNEADADASTPNEADADASTPSEADVSTPSDSSDEDILLSELAPKKQSTCAFPFRIGTFVAFEFPQGIFVGHITKLYPGEDLCQVTFTDGDIGDYDTDEILYATQLYEREFPESSD